MIQYTCFRNGVVMTCDGNNHEYVSRDGKAYFGPCVRHPEHEWFNTKMEALDRCNELRADKMFEMLRNGQDGKS